VAMLAHGGMSTYNFFIGCQSYLHPSWITNRSLDIVQQETLRHNIASLTCSRREHAGWLNGLLSSLKIGEILISAFKISRFSRLLSPKVGHRNYPSKDIDCRNILTWPFIGKLLRSTFCWYH
jgi:hypothetical protein